MLYQFLAAFAVSRKGLAVNLCFNSWRIFADYSLLAASSGAPQLDCTSIMHISRTFHAHYTL
jgi:hypothetical protein